MKILSNAEMARVRDELERVSSGTPQEQAAVVAWAAQYGGAYFRTGSGALRRVFPKKKKLKFLRS